MGKGLAGTIIIYNGISQDYCYEESIRCLQALCDFVLVIDCGSTDGTAKDLERFVDDKTVIVLRETKEWESVKGREKLNYFTNIAIDTVRKLGCEWQINLQADEVIHEDCFPAIRQAIEENNEGYFVERINLWGNSQYRLEVTQHRKPVSTAIIRLCKTNYQSVGDAESLACPANDSYYDKIRFYHMGFVRDKYKHIEKIKHIQDEVFLMDHDKRVDNMPDGFEPLSMGFTKEDLQLITEPLPIFIQEWAKQRDKINNFNI